MHKTLASIIAFLLVGCANSVAELNGPDGSPIKTAKCNVNREKCLITASQSCQPSGGYQVLSSESHMGGLLADWMVGPVIWYSMAYRCGPSDGVLPTFNFGGQQFTPPPMVVPTAPGPKTTNCNTIGSNTTCRTW